MNDFNEATRVQIPGLVHLTRIGYTYFGKIIQNTIETNTLKLQMSTLLPFLMTGQATLK